MTVIEPTTVKHSIPARANRLKTLTGPQGAVSYAYNGLGDRLQETVNGATTNFSMDLNAGVTQVLSNGTNTYIYGVDRVAQVNSLGSEYFLGDALGSVRQMANSAGTITLTKAYEPYGTVTQTNGPRAVQVRIYRGISKSRWNLFARADVFAFDGEIFNKGYVGRG